MSAPASSTRSLAQQRCFNHFQREAAARCTECSQFFCRECIADHDDRVVCAACLIKLFARPKSRARRFGGMWRLGQCALGFFLLWFFFYFVGESLLAIPTNFHEGTLWRTDWIDSP